MNYISTKEILERTKNLVLLDNQKDFREQFATFLSSHCLRVKCLASGLDASELPAISMIAIASSGSGKTYVTSQLSKAAGIKVITVDCSTLSRTGWRGVNLGRLIDAEHKRTSSKEEFETCVIHFDEFDKVRFTGEAHADAGNPQPDFLKLFDGEVLCESDNSPQKYNTTRMAFLFTGAFSGLEDTIRERMAPKKIGFAANNTEEITDYLAHVAPEDLTEYGIMKELVGRIGLIAHIPRLSESDYMALIRGGDGSLCKRYDNLFKAKGVAVSVSDAACKHLASVYSGHDLGARAAVPTFQKHVFGKLKDIEANSSINKITLDYNDDNGYFIRESYGERVSPKQQEKKPAPSLQGWEPRDISFAEMLKGKDGVDRAVREVMAAYARTGFNEFELVRRFLNCAFLYLKHNCNEEDQRLGSLIKLVNRTRRGSVGVSTFRVIIDNGIQAMSYLNPTESDLLRSFLDKFGDFCTDDYWAELLIKHVKATCSQWYMALYNEAREEG